MLVGGCGDGVFENTWVVKMGLMCWLTRGVKPLYVDVELRP